LNYNQSLLSEYDCESPSYFRHYGGKEVYNTLKTVICAKLFCSSRDHVVITYDIREDNLNFLTIEAMWQFCFWFGKWWFWV